MERRLSVILLADIVGYSRLTGVDEEGTIARQKLHFDEVWEPKVAEHAGRVVKSTGDGLFVEFASVVDAVRCAIEVQQLLAQQNLSNDNRIEYRIGVNLGDVIIDGDDILGDGVNVAARLEGLASPGGICISGAAYDQLAGKVNADFEDGGEQTVKNIPRPVRVWHWPANPGTRHQSYPLQTYRQAALALSAALLALLIAGVAWWTFSATDDQPDSTLKASLTIQTGKPVIAVLPFDNLNKVPEQEYFSDGITQDLITDLSKVGGVNVIARHSTFSYKGSKVTVQRVAHDLGASHLVEGSVRKSGRRFRINATLIEARTGHQLWADRYDREISDVFAVQDEVTRRIVAALSVKLKINEQRRLSRTAKVNPEAYDLVLRGLEKFHRYTDEGVIEARSYFKKAIAIDPGFARAHADLALTHGIEVRLGQSADPEASLREAQRGANHALTLDDTIREVHFVLAIVYFTEPEKGIAAARKAIGLDPNYADGYAALAANLNHAGRPKEAVQAIKKAMHLNPRHPFFYVLLLGQANYLLGNYEAAAALFERVRTSNPHFTLAHKMLAATYVALGRTDDAEWAVAELLTLVPEFDLKEEHSSVPFKDPSVFKLYIDRLRKAGLK